MAVRVGVVLEVRDLPFFDQPVGDARGYYDWARTIASASGFRAWLGDTSFYQAPLYPYVLGAWMRLAGDGFLGIRLFQALLGAAGCVLLAAATARLFDRRTGLICGALVALYAPGVFYDALIQKAALSSFLICVMVYFTARAAVRPADDEREAGRATFATLCLPTLLASVALGLLIITRENALVWAPCLLAWAVWRGRREAGGSAAVRMGLAVVLGLGIVLAPVALRNRVVGGEWSVSTFQAGPNFFIGNSREADGRYRPLVRGHETPQFERADAVALAEADVGRSLTAREVSDYWMARAWADVRADPARWLGLLVRKTWMVIHAYEVPDVESLAVYRDASLLLDLIAPAWHFGVLLPLGVIGLVMTAGRRRGLSIYYALIGSMIAAVAGFFVLGRYRLPLVPLLMPFAAAGVMAARGSVRQIWQRSPPIENRRRWILGGGIASSAAILANFPGLHPTGRLNALSFMNLGVAYAQRGSDGDLAAAVRCFDRAVAEHPTSAEARYNLALGLDQSGELTAAIEQYRAALLIEPTLMNADYNLAVALERAGRTQEAIVHYRAAIRVNPADEEAAAALVRLTGG